MLSCVPIISIRTCAIICCNFPVDDFPILNETNLGSSPSNIENEEGMDMEECEWK